MITVPEGRILNDGPDLVPECSDSIFVQHIDNMLGMRFDQDTNLISFSAKHEGALKQRATDDDALHRWRYRFLPRSKGNHIVRSADAVTPIKPVSRQVGIQRAEQYRHLPQVLGGMFNKQVRGSVSLDVWKVLDRHLIVLGCLCVR